MSADSSRSENSRRPPSFLLVKTSFIRGLARLVFKLAGWRVVGAPPPDTPKYVMICAPHTSYWDGFWMLGCSAILRIDLRFLGKHTMFKGPLGWFMSSLGAVPVVRTERQNTVQAAADWFRSNETFLLGVAPEGTRRLTRGWKTGFYWIAVEAKVPIACAFVDYRTKTGGFTGDLIHPTGDIEKDFVLFQKAYAKITPKFPEKMSPIEPIAQAPREGANPSE